jgi:hypothetical protein
MDSEKYGCWSASRTVIRSAGSNARSFRTRSKNSRLIMSVGGITSCEVGECLSLGQEDVSYMQWPSSFNIFLTLPSGLWLWPVELMGIPKELRFRPCTSSSKTVRHLPHDHLHHCEMFKVVVRLIQGETSKEFDKDAT